MLPCWSTRVRRTVKAPGWLYRCVGRLLRLARVTALLPSPQFSLIVRRASPAGFVLLSTAAVIFVPSVLVAGVRVTTALNGTAAAVGAAIAKNAAAAANIVNSSLRRLQLRAPPKL